MPVSLPAPVANSLLPVAGVELGWAEAHIRKPGRKDLLVVRLAPGTQVAGVFTLNRYCAAPVTVCREHLARVAEQGTEVRALVVNTGCANAGTGQPGLDDARKTCAELAQLLGCEPHAVLPFSTGVILEPLPMDRLLAGLAPAVARLGATHWLEAAQAIMTTDTVAKAKSAQVTLDGVTVTVTGISKGSGMIHPNMATMLGFLATDATIDGSLMPALTRRIADASFNCITVDGDTSTNDSFILMASGQSGLAPIVQADDPRLAVLEAQLVAVAKTLAQAIVRDGEGATKFIEIHVEEARSVAEARAVADAIALSPLVKTAFFASDPNLGRILAAIGKAGIADLDPETVTLHLNEVEVARHGGRHPDYREEDGKRVMAGAEIRVGVRLGRGQAHTCIWTCDLSHEYVSINADYRS